MDLNGDIFTFGEWKLDSEAASGPLRPVVLETNYRRVVGHERWTSGNSGENLKYPLVN
jgi:hypothetical protein